MRIHKILITVVLLGIFITVFQISRKNDISRLNVFKHQAYEIADIVHSFTEGNEHKLATNDNENREGEKAPNQSLKEITDVYLEGFADMRDTGFLDYLNRVWIKLPSRAPLNLRNPSSSKYSEISTFVDNLLKQRYNGFFIECGAADGEKTSNTLLFEKERNWTGLLIEPNPQFFETLIQKRRNAYTVNVCLSVSNHSSIEHFKFHSYYGRIDTSSNSESDKVQCFPLFALLSALGVEHVDFFSLDIEGFELDVLKTIPFDKLTIDVISIECLMSDFEGTREKLETLRKFFRMIGIYKEVGLIYHPKPGDKKSPDSAVHRVHDVIFKRI